MGNGTREITSDDGTRDRKSGDRSVLPVCKMKQSTSDFNTSASCKHHHSPVGF